MEATASGLLRVGSPPLGTTVGTGPPRSSGPGLRSEMEKALGGTIS
jgi:hypothetical protein